MELNDFESLVGTAFTVRAGEGTVSLRLEKAEKLPNRSGARKGRTAPFSLLFSGPAAEALKQGMFQLEHIHTAPSNIFIVPVAQENDTLYYEAVFN